MSLPIRLVLPAFSMRLAGLGGLAIAGLSACGGKEFIYIEEEAAEGITAADTGGGDDGSDGPGETATDEDGDGYSAEVDCDDRNPDVNPGTVEVCNGLDDDCDGAVDDVAMLPSWFLDEDGDGWGAADSEPVRQCDAPDDYVDRAGDCDDGRADVFPGAPTDVCEGSIDADCDGSPDHEDVDGDGYLSCDDCDDSDAEVHPGAVEVCNGLDDDCDGQEDGPTAVDAQEWYADTDGDSFGDADAQVVLCEAPSGYVSDASDCDDGDASSFPGGTEVCDGADNDCDGTTDGPTATDASTFYADADSDGFGDASASLVDCSAPTGFVTDATDCDDSDASAFPGGTEVCGGGDEDCDGLTDDADDSVTGGTDWYADLDGDLYGDAASVANACVAPGDYVSDNTDCDDSDADIFPAATELCDDVDNNCDGTIDEDSAADARSWYLDSDGDHYGVSTTTQACDWPAGYAALSGDCDDADDSVNPGATEVWYDGTDTDCSGGSDYDADGDGYDSEDESSTGTDCDDTDASINPGEAEVWYDGFDSDCDGANDYDADGDGYDSDEWGGADCEDTVASANPAGTEVWYDGVDGDCDGRSDYDADFDGFDSSLYSGKDCDDTDRAIHPYAWEDDSDGIDNDCDTYTDTADTDTLYDLGLGDDDDGSVIVTVSGGWAFPICGDAYSEFYLNGNGLLTFDVETDEYFESESGLTSDYAPAIALYWDDFDLGDSADANVYGQVHGDAITLHFRQAPEWYASTTNDFSLTLLGDGRIIWDFGTMASYDGMVGWACGTGTGDEVDWSAELEVGTEGLPTIGTGTEDAMWQLFGWSDRNDLEDTTLWACATAGDDKDGDGFTDLCGDPDDTDASVTP